MTSTQTPKRFVQRFKVFLVAAVSLFISLFFYSPFALSGSDNEKAPQPDKTIAPENELTKEGSSSSTLSKTLTNLQKIQPDKLLGPVHPNQFRPQFIFEDVTGGQAVLIDNFCIGDGFCPTNPAESYEGDVYPWSPDCYCGSFRDEEDNYIDLMGGGEHYDITGRGHYNILRIRDQFRELTRDDLSLYLATPMVSTNVVRLGMSRARSMPLWRIYQMPADEIPYELASNRGAIRILFANRNFIRDGFNFRYGRYLFNLMDSDSYDVRNFLDVDEELLEDRRNLYSWEATPETVFNCPYSFWHRLWGFTCGQMAQTGAYDSHYPGRSSAMAPRSEQESMPPQLWDTMRDVFRDALNLMGYRISNGYWGNLAPTELALGINVWNEQQQLRGIIGAVYDILIEMEDRMLDSSTGVAGALWNRLSNGASNIRGFCGDLPDMALVAVDFGEGSEDHRVVFPPYICSDAQAARMDSHANFNVESNETSYGQWQNGGLWEDFFLPNRGYERVFDNTADTMIAQPIDGDIPSCGYLPYLVARMAHQLCHAFGRENFGEFNWGLPATYAEERLCVAAEALILQQLHDADYLCNDTAMQTEEYNPVNQVNQPEWFVGRHFYYEDYPRAHGGIYVGTYLEDMAMITNNLRSEQHERAMVGAQLVSMCPFLGEPVAGCVDGECDEDPFDEDPVSPGDHVTDTGETVVQPVLNPIQLDNCNGLGMGGGCE